jgi:hypothetical protein
MFSFILQFGSRPGFIILAPSQIHRRLEQLHVSRRQLLTPLQRAAHIPGHIRPFSNDVCCHCPFAHDRRLCRASELQSFSHVLLLVGAFRVRAGTSLACCNIIVTHQRTAATTPLPTGFGAQMVGFTIWGLRISLVASSSMSPLPSAGSWFAELSALVADLTLKENRFLTAIWCFQPSASECFGSVGMASTLAARSPLVLKLLKPL